MKEPLTNRMQRSHPLAFMLLVALLLGGCNNTAQLPVSAGMGADPALPAPEQPLVPTVDIAPAERWDGDEQPRAANGLRVNAFAQGLEHPRWLYCLPNGDVLVAETNAPSGSGGFDGIRAWVMGLVMKRAGAAVPSPNRITLLRDSDGDGRADMQAVFLEDLNSPFGMVLVGRDFYVANTDAVLRFDYTEGATSLSGPGELVASLPAGELNHHWTKNIIADREGQKLYVTVGSNSNVAENGMDKEANRAAILEIDRSSGATRVFASGLRNPNGLAWHPASGELWTTVNERDELGGDLVPDYMTAVRENDFFGWPYSYYGNHVDTRVVPQRPDLVARARRPDYALGPHTASLGLAFYDAELLPDAWRGGAFVGQHGSWNRTPLSGYKVIFVPFEAGKPSGEAVDVLSGFVNDSGDAHGRPVGVIVDTLGAVLVADDVGNTIWRLTPQH